MKPTLFAPPKHGRDILAGRLRNRCLSIFAAAVAMGLGAGAAYAQGPYYQPQYSPGSANNPGGNNGAVGSALNYVDLLISQSNANTTLYYPVPAGFTAATAAQINAAVTTAATNAAAGTAPNGVTLQTLATQIVNNQAANAAGALTALANGVIAQSAANAGSNLANVMGALASAYPTNFSTYTSGIFTAAAANSTVANSMSTILVGATNTAGLSDQTVGALTAQAMNATAGSSLSSGQKQTVLQGVVSGQMSAPQVYSSAAAIQAVMVSATTSTVLGAVPLANILNSAVSGLPVASRTNTNVGAIAVAALVSSPSNAATIQSTLSSASAGTAAYTNQVVNGFNNGSNATSYANTLAANPNATDAIIAGATAAGALSPTTLIQSALSSGSSVSVQNIVYAAVTADLTKGTSNAATIAGAAVMLNNSTANYLQISQGAVGAARPADAGSIVFTEISDSPGYTSPAQGAGSLNATNVSNVVTGAVNGAYLNGKTSGISGIVYNAENAAYNTSSALTASVTAGVNAILANDGSSDKPTYIAVSAALAGYGGTVTTTNDPNLQAILSAASTADSRSVAVNAFTAATNLVNSIRLTTATSYISTFNSFVSNVSASDTFQALLYAGSLADTYDTSAILAAAIAKGGGTINTTTLLADAVNANPTKQAALNIAYTVATHISGTTADLTSFVGYQVQQNIANVADVAAAAVAVDPNQAHFIARAVGYSDPQTAYTAVKSLFAYAQITTHGQNSNPSNPIDQTAAAAAISAGFTIGIIEAQNSPSMTASGIQTALSNGIQAAVLAAVSQSGIALQGATLASSLGTNTTTSTNKKSVGAAGVITGFISQTVNVGNTALGQSNLSAAVIDAALKAAVQNGGATYALQMAQAAGQAFGYISAGYQNGPSVANLNSTQITAIATEIGNDLYTPGGVALQNLINAATFGLNQGQAKVLGAGATGVSSYGQYNAQGAPVTDIFNL